MKPQLNLMTQRACRQLCLRKRIKQWSVVLACVGMLLVPVWLVCWWPIYQQGQKVAAIEGQYEPIRQMMKASRSFQKRLDLIKVQEKTALELAKVDTPVVTLLGLLGQAVTEQQGQVHISELEFRQDTRILGEQESSAPSALAMSGRGIDQGAVQNLTSSLQDLLPFAELELKTSGLDTVNGLETRKFEIESSF